jgi:outer membrane protein
MKRGFLRSCLGAAATLMFVAAPSYGTDLLAVYDQALVNDPQIREADATRRANREVRPQAIGALLPQLQGNAGKNRQWSDGTGFQQTPILDPTTGQVSVQTTGTGGEGVTTTKTWGLQARQSVFSWANWMTLRMANDQVAQAEADYMVSMQSLAQRVAQQYFAVLQAHDTLEAVEAAREAVQRQLDQSERRFEVGLIAITDVQDARSARDDAAAAVIASKRALASAEEQLRATIGEKPESLNEPAENMPLVSPNPASEDEWVKIAMEQNLSLISSRLAADIARDTVKGTYSNFLPQVDLQAGRTYSDQDGSNLSNGFDLASGRETYGKSVALTITMPLFTSGTNLSRTRQSQYRWIAAKERLERTSRDTERTARDAYQSVTSEMARVQALKQAVQSSQTSLAANEAGYEVGTRTSVDVLAARRQLIQAQTNYSGAKYSYLNNIITLRLAAGDLDRSVLEEINRWLTVPVVPPPRDPPPVAPAQQ